MTASARDQRILYASSPIFGTDDLRAVGDGLPSSQADILASMLSERNSLGLTRVLSTLAEGIWYIATVGALRLVTSNQHVYSNGIGGPCNAHIELHGKPDSRERPPVCTSFALQRRRADILARRMKEILVCDAHVNSLFGRYRIFLANHTASAAFPRFCPSCSWSQQLSYGPFIREKPYFVPSCHIQLSQGFPLRLSV